MPNVPRLVPNSQFPQEALAQSVQTPPEGSLFPQAGAINFTWNIATAADAITPWGRNYLKRDRELRDFFPTETFMAGALANVAFRNTTLDWEIRGPSDKIIQSVTDMLKSAIAGDSFGWSPFIQKFSQDLYSQDNGGFIELIRDPTLENFKNENAPVLGIAHLDANQCIRTGNPENPVLYTDTKGTKHRMKWYQVIPFSDFPSAIQSMNGVGYCAITRSLRMAQIMRSIMIYKDEKVSGRHYKQLHFVSGISRAEIQDEMKRGQEEANNSGLVRFILPSVLASLDPEKPVSTATIDLAALPDGFDLDVEMKWYINGLALAFGVDYQEFAPLPGGNIGSSQQSMILHRKGSGKNPAVFMRTLSEGFANYGVLPRGYEMRFNDKDEQESLEKQEVRTKAMEETAIAVNAGILSPQAARLSLVRRGIFEAKDIEGIPEDFGIRQPTNQPVGNRGGNTIVEDIGRQQTGASNLTIGDRLRKMLRR